MRPSPSVTRAYLARGARIWMVTRLLVSGVALYGELNPLRLTVSGIAQITLLSVGLSFLETHRQRERAWLGNLGVQPRTLGLLFLIPALAGEILLGVIRLWPA